MGYFGRHHSGNFKRIAKNIHPKKKENPMDKDIRESIALTRFQIISPILAEPKRAQNDYFREQAGKEHIFARYGTRRISVSAMKAWLKAYRKKGFDGLKPKTRTDCGRPKRLDDDSIKTIAIKCKAYPYWTAQMLYEDLKRQGVLGEPPIHYNTLLRLVKEHGFLSTGSRSDVRKAFEQDNVNELWVCDFMHGPSVKCVGRSAKAILCAIIDDHSRMVVGHAFQTSETISALTLVLKEAFLTHGICKRLYVDGLNENIYRTFYTPLSTLRRADLLCHINRLMGLGHRVSKSAVYQQIQKAFIESKEQVGKTIFLIIDEAHLLQTGPLEELRLLTNFKMDSYDPFILVLSGQSDLRRTMSSWNPSISASPFDIICRDWTRSRASNTSNIT